MVVVCFDVEEGCRHRVSVRLVGSCNMSVRLSTTMIVAWETDGNTTEVGKAAGGEADDVVDAAVGGREPTIPCRVLNQRWLSNGGRRGQRHVKQKVKN